MQCLMDLMQGRSKKFTTRRAAEKQKWVWEDAHFYKQATASGVKGTGNVMQ